MATTTNVSSNYVGTVAGEIIGKSFKEADTIARNLVTILPNIDFQISMRKIEYADGRTDYTCGWQPSGTITLSEKLLTPKKIKLDLEVCKEDLRQIWSSATMGFSAHNDVMPKDVSTALIAEVLASTAQSVDSDIWNGVAATSGSFGGFIPLFNADATVIKAGSGIVSLGAAVTKANVISEIEKVLNATPIRLRKKDRVFGVSANIALAYEQALVSAGISNGNGGTEQQLRYGSTVLEVINALPDNTFVVYEKKNLAFGTGLLADHNEIRIEEDEMKGITMMKLVYTGGVQYANSEDIIWYLTTT